MTRSTTEQLNRAIRALNAQMTFGVLMSLAITVGFLAVAFL